MGGRIGTGCGHVTSGSAQLCVRVGAPVYVWLVQECWVWAQRWVEPAVVARESVPCSFSIQPSSSYTGVEGYNAGQVSGHSSTQIIINCIIILYSSITAGVFFNNFI